MTDAADDPYRELRGLTPPQVLEIWLHQHATDLTPQAISLVRYGFALAQPGSWEQIAPAWLRAWRQVGGPRTM